MLDANRLSPLAVSGHALSVRWLWVVVVLLVAALPGCRGCRQSSPAAADGKPAEADREPPQEENQEQNGEEKKEKKKRPFDIGELLIVPSDDSELSNFVKPAHFVAAVVPVTANEQDVRGTFETAAVDDRNRPIPVGQTSYYLSMSRPAALPKGQARQLGSTFFIPPAADEQRRPVFLQHVLRVARGGREIGRASQVTRPMPAYQYLLPVLSINPNAYAYLQQMEAVRAPFDDMTSAGEQVVYYRVVLPPLQQPARVPSHPFAWTSTAYLIWDGIPPEELTADQQRACLDWLHWGGQLIVSGPASLDLLSDSFLSPYLPAVADGLVALGPAELAELDRQWSLQRVATGALAGLRVSPASPLAGVRLRLGAEARFLPGTGQLVAERSVGRGRMVVTGFTLTSREIVNWGSYDSFLNGCLLRRPPRRFSADQFGTPRVTWAAFPQLLRDPLLVTGVRYFSRDIGPLAAGRPHDPFSTAPQHAGWRTDPQSGVGGWSDQSGAALAAHRLLQEAAGIEVPDAAFVLKALLVYLLVLVPVNWLLFHLLGRVEWAWGAAPVIAVVGAVVVVSMAQLDIGFARSRMEVAIVEVHGGYPRAHVTRYAALYTSLATSYTFQFDDPSAVALPFPPTPSPDRPWPIVLRRERQVALSGFQVGSSRTAFLHVEQMLDLPGTIGLHPSPSGPPELVYDCDWTLEDAGVLWRDAAGQLHTCWLGTVAPRSTVPLPFVAAAQELPWFEPWYNLSAQTTGDGAAIDLRPLFELAARQLPLGRGEMRLIGWCGAPLTGMTVVPDASQQQARTMVLVHLRPGQPAPPAPDENLLVDVRSGQIPGSPDPAAEPGPETPP